jgi:hypothetical protein
MFTKNLIQQWNISRSPNYIMRTGGKLYAQTCVDDTVSVLYGRCAHRGAPQFVAGQLAKLPLLDEDAVGSNIVIGPRAKKPLHLDIPLFIPSLQSRRRSFLPS